jgi:hypothetical protein
MHRNYIKTIHVTDNMYRICDFLYMLSSNGLRIQNGYGYFGFNSKMIMILREVSRV